LTPDRFCVNYNLPYMKKVDIRDQSAKRDQAHGQLVCYCVTGSDETPRAFPAGGGRHSCIGPASAGPGLNRDPESLQDGRQLVLLSVGRLLNFGQSLPIELPVFQLPGMLAPGTQFGLKLPLWAQPFGQGQG